MNRQTAYREPAHDPAVVIHGPEAFAAMRVAGKLAAETLDYIGPFVKPGVTTAELDRLCEQFQRDHGGIPAPLGYKGYPKSVCISINHVVCHGIPGDRKLLDGDILNIDVTPTVDGWHGDSSRMYLAGDKIPLRARKLVDVTYEAMMLGIAQIKPGATLGDVGHAIQSYVEANRFSVVRDFCGHGTGKIFHEAPSVLHYGRPGQGLVLKPGMIFTVEPMVNIGRHEVKILDDGWTAVTRDRSLSAQFEHSIGVTETGVEIFTLSPTGLTKPPYIPHGVTQAPGQLFPQDSAESGHAGHRQRLRDRFMTGGADALPDYELLELLLFAAIPRRDVKPLAKQLIRRFSDFAGVISATPAALAAEGLSDNSIATLKLVQAGALRMGRQRLLDRPVLSSWAALIEYLRAAMAFEANEQFRLLFLDRKNNLIAEEIQARGTVDHTPVYIREVMKRALELGATALILVHNHPSGDPTPSRADIEMTRDIAKAAAPLGVTIHDHIIVGRGEPASLRALGLLG